MLTIGRFFWSESTVDLDGAELSPQSSIGERTGIAGSSTPRPAEAIEAAASSSDLHQHLLALTEAHRNSTILMILRDVEAECREVVSSQLLAADIRTWQADCGGTQSYSIVFDAFGATTVYPIPYGDFDPGVTWTISPIEPQ